METALILIYAVPAVIGYFLARFALHLFKPKGSRRRLILSVLMALFLTPWPAGFGHGGTAMITLPIAFLFAFLDLYSAFPYTHVTSSWVNTVVKPLLLMFGAWALVAFLLDQFLRRIYPEPVAADGSNAEPKTQ